MKLWLGVLVILVFVFGAYGWCANIYKLCHDDFIPPFKAESFRIIGVFVPPVGAVTGYVTFKKEQN